MSMDTLAEAWKPIERFDGLYEISNLGRVRWIDGRIKKLTVGDVGYLYCGFQYKKKHFSVRLHRLLAESFIPNPQNLPQVNHCDGNKLNNDLNNLEWCSPKQNIHHAIKNGLTKVVGQDAPTAKLTDSDVVAIRELWRSGKWMQREIAKMFGVSAPHICGIVKGRFWKHLA